MYPPACTHRHPTPSHHTTQDDGSSNDGTDTEALSAALTLEEFAKHACARLGIPVHGLGRMGFGRPGAVAAEEGRCVVLIGYGIFTHSRTHTRIHLTKTTNKRRLIDWFLYTQPHDEQPDRVPPPPLLALPGAARQPATPKSTTPTTAAATAAAATTTRVHMKIMLARGCVYFVLVFHSRRTGEGKGRSNGGWAWRFFMWRVVSCCCFYFYTKSLFSSVRSQYRFVKQTVLAG